MSMFEQLLANLGGIESVAAKLNLPVDKVETMLDSVKANMSNGGDMLGALTTAAQDHGLSLDHMQDILGKAGDGGNDMLGKVSGMLDKDGDGNPLNDLGGMVKGLFGR